jgi:hypothetical protein
MGRISGTTIFFSAMMSPSYRRSQKELPDTILDASMLERVHKSIKVASIKY